MIEYSINFTFKTKQNMKKANPAPAKKAATKKAATTTSKKAATAKSTAPKKASSKPKAKKEQVFKFDVNGQGPLTKDHIHATPMDSKDFILNQGAKNLEDSKITGQTIYQGELPNSNVTKKFQTVGMTEKDYYWDFEREMQKSENNEYQPIIDDKSVKEKDSSIAGKVILTVIILAIIALIFGMS